MAQITESQPGYGERFHRTRTRRSSSDRVDHASASIGDPLNHEMMTNAVVPDGREKRLTIEQEQLLGSVGIRGEPVFIEVGDRSGQDLCTEHREVTVARR